MKHYLTIRNRLFSFLWPKRTLWLLLLLGAATAVIFTISLGSGNMKLNPLQVVLSIVGIGPSGEVVVVQTLRLPRLLIALIVGGALAISGAILQGIIRNPLCSPDIIGITSGASVAAAGFIILSGGAWPIAWLPLSAVAGALGAALLVYALAWKKGVSALRLVLIGIGISSALSAATSFLLVTGDYYAANQAMTWLTGSIYGSSWKDVAIITPWFFALLLAAFLLVRQVNIQALGDDIAEAVGSRIQRDRFLLILLSVAFAGLAVAFGGNIAFIGLMAPHIARILVGPSFGSVLPVSAMVGGLILLLADWAGRTGFPPYDIPAGVFTAAIGAPFFIYLLYRNRHQ